MGWLSNKIRKRLVATQLREMNEFVSNLRAMDSEEIGHIVVLATQMRHLLEGQGHNVMDPIVYTTQNIGFPQFLSSATNIAQKQKRAQDAAALLVWTHTARAGMILELRGMGRELWRQLERGFPYAQEAANGIEHLTGRRMNISGACDFPAGFTPDPH